LLSFHRYSGTFLGDPYDVMLPCPSIRHHYMDTSSKGQV
jgi:hypothetical protein